jgi:CheY-like chemotaxis protein
VDASASDSASPAATRPAARRLLVVDDMRDSADSLTMLLKVMGHEVRTAYGGEAALEAAETFRPDAIFLDLGMPVLDGFEVCRRIRSSPWGVHVFIAALSGWGQPADRCRTREAGFNEHLIKPADPQAIEELLDSITRSSPTGALR